MTRFPTALHEEIAGLSRTFLAGHPSVDTVLVVNSCARGRAIPESDLDLAALVTQAASLDEMHSLELAWRRHLDGQGAVQQFCRTSPFAQVHVDIFNGSFQPTVWNDGGGPDDFELAIGNRVAYAEPLGTAGDHYVKLRRRWLPYYEDSLREQRLEMVRSTCLFDLDHVPFLVGRSLHFAAFDWFYKAYREFLQALFIARRRYPLSYAKWIREQVHERLNLPELYKALPPLLSVSRLESTELGDKADTLRRLVLQWT